MSVGPIMAVVSTTAQTLKELLSAFVHQDTPWQLMALLVAVNSESHVTYIHKYIHHLLCMQTLMNV